MAKVLKEFQSSRSGQICLNAPGVGAAIDVVITFQSPRSGQICLNKQIRRKNNEIH